MNFKIVYGGILIAIVIAVGGYVFPQVKQVAIELGSGTRFQHGISIGTATAPAANGMKIGDNGSEFTELKMFSCTSIIGANTAQVASTTAPYDCAVTGVASGDLVFAMMSTSSPYSSAVADVFIGLPFHLVGAKASTTAGYVTLMWENDMGRTGTLGATGGVASTTNILYGDI